MLLGATLALASVLMEWASYFNSQGAGAVGYMAPVSLKGVDYPFWPYQVALAAAVGVVVLLGARIPPRVTAVVCVAAGLGLTSIGVLVEVNARERAYERGFLVVANNIATATDSQAEVDIGDIPEVERGFAIDRRAELDNIQVSLGSHIPLLAGLLSLAGAALQARRQDGPPFRWRARALCHGGFLVAGASCLMVWGHYQASWPIESPVILLDHPSFTGLDFLQGPLLGGLGAIGIAIAAVDRSGSKLTLWILRGVSTMLMVVGASIFMTAPQDSLDVPLGVVEGSSRAVTLNSLEQIRSEVGTADLFTDEGRFRFELGSAAPFLGGGLALLATFRRRDTKGLGYG